MCIPLNRISTEKLPPGLRAELRTCVTPASVLKLHSSDRFTLLMAMDSWAQAQVMTTLASSPRYLTDAAYLWMQLVPHENGVLGGVLRRHLQAVNPKIADDILDTARMLAMGTELGAQIILHHHKANELRNWQALPTPGSLIHSQQAYLGYFPTLAAAQQDLAARRTLRYDPTVPVPVRMEYVIPNVDHMIAGGVVMAVASGQAFILHPRTPYHAPHFEPKMSIVVRDARIRELFDEISLTKIRQNMEGLLKEEEVLYQILALNPQDIKALWRLSGTEQALAYQKKDIVYLYSALKHRQAQVDILQNHPELDDPDLDKLGFGKAAVEELQRRIDTFHP